MGGRGYGQAIKRIMETHAQILIQTNLKAGWPVLCLYQTPGMAAEGSKFFKPETTKTDANPYVLP